MPMYPSPKAVGVRHLVATKSFMVGLVRSQGAKVALVDWDGTDDEAVQAIKDDPREVFALDCDNFDAKGYCLGHTRHATGRE